MLLIKKGIWIFLSLYTFLFAGLQDYHIITWNAQHATSAEFQWNVNVRQLITGRYAADILMLQGINMLPYAAMRTNRVVQSGNIQVFEYIWNLGATDPKASFIYYAHINQDTDLLIVSKQRADEVIVLSFPEHRLKPIMGIRIANHIFFSAYISWHENKRNTADMIHAATEYFATRPNMHWMIAGSFNQEPHELLEELGERTKREISILMPLTATQSNGLTLDYAIISHVDATSSNGLPAMKAILLPGSIKSYTASSCFPIHFKRF